MPDPYFQWDWFLWNLLFIAPVVLVGMLIEGVAKRKRRKDGRK